MKSVANLHRENASKRIKLDDTHLDNCLIDFDCDQFDQYEVITFRTIC